MGFLKSEKVHLVPTLCFGTHFIEVQSLFNPARVG